MTNEQAKQEAIKKAYGDFYEPNKNIIHNDGTVTSFVGCKMEEKGLIMDYFLTQRSQPQSLGINFNNNNGWIRIEPDGSNLPADYGNLNHSYSVFDIKNSDEEDMTYLMKTHENGVIQLFKQGRITHYKPIKEEPKPIY